MQCIRSGVIFDKANVSVILYSDGGILYWINRANQDGQDNYFYRIPFNKKSAKEIANVCTKNFLTNGFLQE